MCSNLDSELGDGLQLMKVDSDSDKQLTRWCRKCVANTEAKVVLRKKDPYCKECFLASVSHKFRACLGKSKLMKPQDKVLIGFSGSINSMALLHLIKTGLQESSHKKLMILPHIVYIDESAALNMSEEESHKLSSEINDALKQYDFPVYRVPISLSTQQGDSLESLLADGRNSEQDGVVRELFNAFKSDTSKVDLLYKLRYSLLIQVAKHLGISKIFTAESADDLAVKLLTNVSLGRGSQLPYDVGFSDNRDSEVKVIRPLRDISKKELTFYSIFHNLTSVHVPSLLTKIDTHSSIQRLTESFLCELQDGFSSTLSTVFRVADKLTANASDQAVCPLCKTQKDPEGAASSSLNATQFSRLVASLGPTNFNADTLAQNSSDSGCCGGNDKVSEKTSCGSISCSSKAPDAQLLELLCYGCYLILKDADLKTLPAELLRSLRESSQRFKMKKEIEDFLL